MSTIEWFHCNSLFDGVCIPYSPLTDNNNNYNSYSLLCILPSSFLCGEEYHCPTGTEPFVLTIKTIFVMIICRM